jgi:hypothetical protein
VALKAQYTARLTAFIEVSGRHNDTSPETAITQAEVAIEKAWNELSKHRRIHGPVADGERG